MVNISYELFLENCKPIRNQKEVAYYTIHFMKSFKAVVYCTIYFMKSFKKIETIIDNTVSQMFSS